MKNFNFSRDDNSQKSQEAFYQKEKNDRFKKYLSLRKERYFDMQMKKRISSSLQNASVQEINNIIKTEKPNSFSNTELRNNEELVNQQLSKLLSTKNKDEYQLLIDNFISWCFFSNSIANLLAKDKTIKIILERTFFFFKDEQEIYKKTFLLLSNLLLLDDCLTEKSKNHINDLIYLEISRESFDLNPIEYKIVFFYAFLLIITKSNYNCRDKMITIYKKVVKSIPNNFLEQLNSTKIILTLCNVILEKNIDFIENKNYFQVLHLLLNSIIKIISLLLENKIDELCSQEKFSILLSSLNILNTIFTSSDTIIKEIISIRYELLSIIQRIILKLSQYEKLPDNISNIVSKLLYNISLINLPEAIKFFNDDIVKIVISKSFLISPGILNIKLLTFINIIKISEINDITEDRMKEILTLIEKGIFTPDNKIKESCIELIFQLLSRYQCKKSKLIKVLKNKNIISKIEEIYSNSGSEGNKNLESIINIIFEDEEMCEG